MAYASYVFNGTDEVMTRTWSTSSPAPGATMFTYSLWCKVAQYDINDEAVFFQTINDPTNSQYLRTVIYGGGEGIILTNNAGGAGDFDEDCAISPDYGTDVWRHIVLRLDTVQGTAGNRLRIYLDGTLLTADFFTNPGLNSTSNRLFADGFQHQIGAWLDLPVYLSGKIAFIDVLDGVSAAPGDFAFDNGGTWTRKEYTGSYGNYGFSLDGSDGFNDVSGNSQHFTGQNMTTGANLDGADLPPYAVDAALSSAGVASATAVGEAVTTLDAVFSASGSATVSGIASALADSAATSHGTSSAEATDDSENPVDTPEETPVIGSAGGGGTMASPEITIRDLKKIQKRRPRTHIIKIGEWPDEEAERKRREAELFPTIDLEPLLLNMPEADDEDEEALIALLAMVA